ncbi:unnamed protein product [Hymenolepis diminuta]|uniref:Ferritin n=1 Tax=Hymenolepis diminuta TaxID=6216 RepID=A0A0R3SXR3_HYMDI|nr:unnamed protein product [Hymenolepis diminuta]
MPTFFKLLFLVALAYTGLVECELNSVLEGWLNDQINLEYQAFYFYEYLAAYFSRFDKALFGFSAYFKKAASEERHHAHKFIELINKLQGNFKLKSIKIENERLNNLTALDALRMAEEKEKGIAIAFQNIYKLACDDNEFYIQQQLDHFVKEQVEAINNLKTLKTRLNKTDAAVEFLLDQELRNSPSMHE